MSVGRVTKTCVVASAALCGCATVSLRDAFPAPADGGRVAGVIAPVEDRSGSHGAVSRIEPPLAEVFAQALRFELSQRGVPTAPASAAGAPWQIRVPPGARFIVAARINELGISMSSEGTADVDYAVYAPGNPTALRTWTVHTTHAFLDRRGVSAITSDADMAAAVKTLIEENAVGVSASQPEGNVGVLRALSSPPQQQVARTQEPPPVERPPVSGLLAVLEFKNKLKGKDAEAVDGAYFANAVRAAVKHEAPGLTVMTRENVLVLLESSGKSLADCEGECEVDTGRRLGADWVISGDIVRVGTSYKLDLRLHDTHGGQLLNGTAASGHTVDELDADTPRAVAQLLAALR